MTAPERIYLQWIEDESHPYIHEGVTWCADKIEDDDVEYVRADIAARATAEQSRDSAELEALRELQRTVEHQIAHGNGILAIDAALERLRALKSQQDAAIESKLAEQSAWQPIETAPKDGTPLLLFARCKRATASIILIGWHLPNLGWIECAFAPNMPIGIVPTLWMPLPTFPGHEQIESQRSGDGS